MSDTRPTAAPPTEATAASATSVGRPSVGRPSVGRPSVGRPSVGRLRLAIALASIAVLAGCAVSQQRPIGAELKQGCAEARPEVCPADYQPVCADLGNRQRKTYSNACSACADAAVSTYIAGACPADSP